MTKPVLGVIFGNREFFPDQLVSGARKDIVALLDEFQVDGVMPTPEQTKLGGVETYAEAKQCAALFREHADQIDGVLVVLPNFGDERGVLDTLKLSKLDVPILVQGYPDDPAKLDVASRRDAFCGKISDCNNLVQAGIPFSLTGRHVVDPTDASFREDFDRFLGVCRVVGGLRSARLGAIGARPGAFNTVRYSEKILQAAGISVTTVDLSEILGMADRLDAKDARVEAKLDAIRSYVDTADVPTERLGKMARLGVVVDDWMQANELDASAIQCWTSVQENFGINVCTVMSMMSESLMPSACEVDVTGVLTMYAMQLASQSPSALVDWNNNYGDDPNKCVLFHCGNWAKSFVPSARISTSPILGSMMDAEKTYGTLDGVAEAGPLTFARVSTDDTFGQIRAYVGEGQLTDDPVPTFGNRAVAEIPNLQGLMRYICQGGYEHHVAMTQSRTSDILAEAMETYLGWETYGHV